MLEWLRRHALDHDEPQEQLAIQLMKAAADEIMHGKRDYAALRQFIANQPWSKEEARQRLEHRISLLDNYRDNRLRDHSIEIARTVSAGLDERPGP